MIDREYDAVEKIDHNERVAGEDKDRKTSLHTMRTSDSAAYDNIVQTHNRDMQLKIEEERAIRMRKIQNHLSRRVKDEKLRLQEITKHKHIEEDTVNRSDAKRPDRQDIDNEIERLYSSVKNRKKDKKLN